MDLEKFFELVDKIREQAQGLTKDQTTVLETVLVKRSEVLDAVDRLAEIEPEYEKMRTKITKLEEDNFKYRERARTQDSELETKIADATKKLQAEIEELTATLEEQKEAARLAALRSDLLQTGVAPELIDKALKLVDDEHFTEEKSKGEDGKEVITRVFDKDKFREDNAILFVNSKLKGIGGAGRLNKTEETTLQVTERYLDSQYSRPDKKGAK